MEGCHCTQFRGHTEPARSVPWAEKAANGNNKEGTKHVGICHSDVWMVLPTVESSHNIIFIDNAFRIRVLESQVINPLPNSLQRRAIVHFGDMVRNFLIHLHIHVTPVVWTQDWGRWVVNELMLWLTIDQLDVNAHQIQDEPIDETEQRLWESTSERILHIRSNFSCKNILIAIDGAVIIIQITLQTVEAR